MGFLKLPKKLELIKEDFDSKLNVFGKSNKVLDDKQPLTFSDMKLTLKTSDGTTYSVDLSKEILSAADVLQSIDYLNRKINVLNGIDTKSIGYLYGGYKSGNAIDHIQRYNTMTESSKDIYTTGKKVRYLTGITTLDKGYFTWDNNGTWYWSRFDYVDEKLGATLSATLPIKTVVSAYNMGVGDKALVAANKTYTFSPKTETFTEISNSTLNNLTHTTRQALNNVSAAFIIDKNKDSPHYIFEWATNSISTDSNHIRPKDQYATGLSKDKGRGYWVDKTTLNRVNYDGKTILSIAKITYPFKPHYGESHSLQSDNSGFMMAGYDDNIGDFGGGQHGYVSKMSWETETATRLSNLAFPQSSGEMVQR